MQQMPFQRHFKNLEAMPPELICLGISLADRVSLSPFFYIYIYLAT